MASANAISTASIIPSPSKQVSSFEPFLHMGVPVSYFLDMGVLLALLCVVWGFY